MENMFLIVFQIGYHMPILHLLTNILFTVIYNVEYTSCLIYFYTSEVQHFTVFTEFHIS